MEARVFVGATQLQYNKSLLMENVCVLPVGLYLCVIPLSFAFLCHLLQSSWFPLCVTYFRIHKRQDAMHTGNHRHCSHYVWSIKITLWNWFSVHVSLKVSDPLFCLWMRCLHQLKTAHYITKTNQITSERELDGKNPEISKDLALCKIL